MSKPVIIGFPPSSFVWTSRAALSHKGVDHEFRPLTPPESKQEEHLARHPWGKVPVFTHGDVTLYETTAICSYVDTVFDGPALQPSDNVALARMHQWVSIINSYLYPEAVPKFLLQFVFPSGPDGAPNQEVIAEGAKGTRMALEQLNAGVAGKWMCGDDNPTLADYFLGPFLFSLPNFPGGKELFDGLDNLVRIKGQLVETPAFISNAPPPPQ